MTKCDFCTQSSPSGKCPYSLQGTREDYCKEAIKQMVKAFGQDTEKKKKKFWQK